MARDCELVTIRMMDRIGRKKLSEGEKGKWARAGKDGDGIRYSAADHSQIHVSVIRLHPS